MIVVSACLAGLNTRYDGTSRVDEEVVSLLSSGRAIPVCPEQLGGLPTPRPRAEIEAGDGRDVLSGRARVVSEHGEDLTERFVKGAYEVLKLVELMGVEEAILKDGSPSCGVNFINRGGERTRGTGVTSALLALKGIKVRCNDTL